MHHYQAKGGTVFNFNSDMSGEALVWPESDVDFYVRVPGDDLLEFARWYIKEYERNDR